MKKITSILLVTITCLTSTLFAQDKFGQGAEMMRLAKDLDMDVSDDKYDRLNYY